MLANCTNCDYPKVGNEGKNVYYSSTVTTDHNLIVNPEYTYSTSIAGYTSAFSVTSVHTSAFSVTSVTEVTENAEV